MKTWLTGLLLLLTTAVVLAQADEPQKDITDGQSAAPGDAKANEWSDEWGDDWSEQDSPVTHAGFLEWGHGERLDRDPLLANTTTLSELRWHQQFDYSHERWVFNWSHDVWFDAVPNSDEGGLLFDLRELNFQFPVGQQTDVVLGRQITTWGTGDLLFINDQFPKDWLSFFSGRDDNYLKAPADAIRITRYFKPFNVDWVITPTAAPDRFINGERFALFVPSAAGRLGGFEVINPQDPSDPEYAMRVFGNHQGLQWALYGYHGISKSPLGVNDQQRPYFPAKNVWGASVQGIVGKGLYHAEVGQHQALEDRQGNNPWVPNSQWRVLLGYERELISQLNWGVQYYLEHTQDHERLLANSLSPEFEPEKNRHVITNRLTYRAMQDKLTWSLFMYYSPTDEDSYWRPTVQYRHSDRWLFSVGGNLFTGADEHTFFGQFEDASNWFARLRFQY
ncbi:hypothetical protein [Marinicella meishanensis]|uniref:hypothetical protein n=1 Tax=Marinicella meishanensis TaxID=2873263 RepID=UPI001CBEF8EF|nr:hypothetical protein [Marinicella sp. NBU2979]